MDPLHEAARRLSRVSIITFYHLTEADVERERLLSRILRRPELLGEVPVLPEAWRAIIAGHCIAGKR